MGVIWGLEAEAPTDEKRAITRNAAAGLTLGVDHRSTGVREQPRILRREVDAHGLRTDALDEALWDLRADRDVADPQERTVLVAAGLEEERVLGVLVGARRGLARVIRRPVLGRPAKRPASVAPRIRLFWIMKPRRVTACTEASKP